MPPYHYDSPIKRVAIIGGGPSGVPAARQLRDAGLEIVLLEQQPRVGGVWNYYEDKVDTLQIPTPPPILGAFTPSVGQSGSAGGPARPFQSSTPCYWSLTNNVPTKTMAFKDYPYPPGTPDNIPHHRFAEYIYSYWKAFELPALTRLNTRVERASKERGKWRLELRNLPPRGPEQAYEEYFDAVLVSTGHYTAPVIPKLPGLAEWAELYPRSIIHSKGYRRPETYRDQTVLIVGSGTSGTDIAKDLSGLVRRLVISSRIDQNAPTGYQIFRAGQRDRRPAGSESVAQIKSFRPDRHSIQAGVIELSDGTELTGIDAIIFCTGYQYSFPFLPHLHQKPGSSATDDSLVINGDHVLNLYRDVFYIPDPTLAFVGLSVNTSAFSFFEYQSISVARVFAGTAHLPSQVEQRLALAQVSARKGPGKFRHFLGQAGERAYVRETVEWLNREAQIYGVPLIEGHSKEWLYESDQIAVKIAAKFGVDPTTFGDLSGNIDLPNILNQSQPITSQEAIPKPEFIQSSTQQAITA